MVAVGAHLGRGGMVAASSARSEPMLDRPIANTWLGYCPVIKRSGGSAQVSLRACPGKPELSGLGVASGAGGLVVGTWHRLASHGQLTEFSLATRIPALRPIPIDPATRVMARTW
jgi:hypothetical protein